jgi:hypothetical protein
VQFGGTPYTVVIDTGSSDIWLAQTGFQCVSPNIGTPVSEAQCAFGPLYIPSSTLIKIPGLEFNVSYAGGEKLECALGYELVNIAELSIEQMVGIVDTAAWYGGGQSSGLLGLGYPSIDSATIIRTYLVTISQQIELYTLFHHIVSISVNSSATNYICSRTTLLAGCSNPPWT